MAEADRKMSGKAGNFLLEMLGWYDLLRLTGEYDPVTGGKLSAGDKTLAAIMLGLSIFPPAKAVGVGGKVAVAGAKAGKAGSKVDFSISRFSPRTRRFSWRSKTSSTQERSARPSRKSTMTSSSARSPQRKSGSTTLSRRSATCLSR
ncbi:pre-toxin TG domain-containing protein [Bacillus sp. REN3]|uniref:pre-toxin TG domain-containing protein n=1 Tax=Bacillus sp. REN3 TaxID=2802440 RepID=UPI001AEE3513|nr:pre-toxin TG domain-containing protein [Bacillus sp. REN3]